MTALALIVSVIGTVLPILFYLLQLSNRKAQGEIEIMRNQDAQDFIVCLVDKKDWLNADSTGDPHLDKTIERGADFVLGHLEMIFSSIDQHRLFSCLDRFGLCNWNVGLSYWLICLFVHPKNLNQLSQYVAYLEKIRPERCNYTPFQLVLDRLTKIQNNKCIML